ncbi:DUF4386 domain-containing protein [Nocardia sp. alder85J]|uniref:DUF4386 domain-containing protein n=1 Tax=Nocardia sp. alder85J TaxID=2862949 RepID=UPI001CD2FD3A|nr:DUF4386 domain-containing protein [Nocardia sp. alder85J]MCX4090986.1 DUF4386 domain-containing protein [Nocardia sp. alder85J]
MTATAPEHPTPTRRPQSGPPLWLPATVFAVLTIAYVVVNRSTPHPDATALDVLRYDGDHAGALKLGAFLMLGSAVPLAITSAVTYRRLRALGITAPGSAIALVGGALAASTLMLSAMFAWTAGRLGADSTPALAKALADLGFVAGGPAFATLFGLLVAGIAVPGLLARLLPAPLALIGLALALVAEVASLGLLVRALTYLLPIVRFGGLIWLLAAAAVLPLHRPRRTA